MLCSVALHEPLKSNADGEIVMATRLLCGLCNDHRGEMGEVCGPSEGGGCQVTHRDRIAAEACLRLRQSPSIWFWFGFAFLFRITLTERTNVAVWS